LVASALEFAFDNIVGTLLVAESCAGLGDVTRGLDVECTTVVLECWKSDRAEVAIHVGGTTNSLESREVDGCQQGIVLDLETTSDSLKNRERDVGQLGVGIDGKSASDESQVRSVDARDGILVETERPTNVSQRWNRDGWDIAEGQVLSTQQVREACSETVAIGLQNQGLGNGGHLEADIL